VEYAEEKKIDLIVIGSKGMSGLKRMLLGSVASGVVTYADCPVLVVK
jgi:nucleotide-binding universal stress UspA family protein